MKIETDTYSEIFMCKDEYYIALDINARPILTRDKKIAHTFINIDSAKYFFSTHKADLKGAYVVCQNIFENIITFEDNDFVKT